MSDDVGRPRGRRPLRPATAERDCSDSSDAVARKVPRRSAVGKPRRVHKHTYQTRKVRKASIRSRCLRCLRMRQSL